MKSWLRNHKLGKTKKRGWLISMIDYVIFRNARIFYNPSFIFSCSVYRIWRKIIKWRNTYNEIYVQRNMFHSCVQVFLMYRRHNCISESKWISGMNWAGASAYIYRMNRGVARHGHPYLSTYILSGIFLNFLLTHTTWIYVFIRSSLILRKPNCIKI